MGRCLASDEVRGFSDDELQKRRDWVDKYVDKGPEWWQQRMNNVAKDTRAPCRIGCIRGIREGGGEEL